MFKRAGCPFKILKYSFAINPATMCTTSGVTGMFLRSCSPAYISDKSFVTPFFSVIICPVYASTPACIKYFSSEILSNNSFLAV